MDRADLTSGSTFHSAGLVGQLRSSVPLTKMIMYSVELYAGLAEETGIDPGCKQSIAYAYLPYAQATPGMPLAVEVFGEWVPARPVKEPLWDRKGERIRA